MNNSDVKQILDECLYDIVRVKNIIDYLGATSNVVPYLAKYSIIRACGAIEIAFKTIVADYCSKRSKIQVKFYLSKKVRDSSANPSYSNICKMLGDFDNDWKKNFKDRIKAHHENEVLMTSMQSLVDARNDFAHGGNPGLTINDTISYYQKFYDVMIILDSVVS